MPMTETREAQKRPRQKLAKYLHVKDFVRALRVPCDVAYFGGRLRGQRGRGVSVDSRVAQRAVAGRGDETLISSVSGLVSSHAGLVYNQNK